jgi:chromosome segregation ATPase
MSETAELEARITAALDRAEQALEALSVREEGDTRALKEELEAERTANAQLEERVRAIKERQDATVADLEDQVKRLRQAVGSRDGELQRMRSVNAELRQSNQALREANAEGLADAQLVNSSMMTELEALRALQAADRAEIDDILATLDPVLKEA